MIDYPIERQLEFVCLERDEALAHIAALTAALESIAKNTCCDRCQEAALVAQAVLNIAPATKIS